MTEFLVIYYLKLPDYVALFQSEKFPGHFYYKKAICVIYTKENAHFTFVQHKW
jgi:hypothetical protein